MELEILKYHENKMLALISLCISSNIFLGQNLSG